MGFQLITAALDPSWATLTPLARLVLVVMARIALDPAEDGRAAGIYYAGHGYLSLAIYGTDEPEERQAHALKRALAELVKVGAVERLRHANGRRPARYQLTLGPFLPVDNPVDNS